MCIRDRVSSKRITIIIEEDQDLLQKFHKYLLHICFNSFAIKNVLVDKFLLASGCLGRCRIFCPDDGNTIAVGLHGRVRYEHFFKVISLYTSCLIESAMFTINIFNYTTS